jgi:predicted dehydrogenase
VSREATHAQVDAPRKRPVAIGLAGAGPWARTRYAPLFSAGPETRLAAVWSRRPGSARPIADEYGAQLAMTFDELVDSCDAVVMCVPPTVQTELAPVAAAAGRALLLEEPLAVSLPEAERLARVIEDSGVLTMFALTFRFAANVRGFIDSAREFGALGARGCMLTGSQRSGPYAQSAWRLEEGVLLNEGPHIIDMADAALGTIVRVQAHGRGDGWIGMLFEHDGGVISDFSLSNRVSLSVNQIGIDLFGAAGALRLNVAEALGTSAFETLRRDFASVARGAPHPIDIRRALHVQRLLDMVKRALAN